MTVPWSIGVLVCVRYTRHHLCSSLRLQCSLSCFFIFQLRHFYCTFVYIGVLLYCSCSSMQSYTVLPCFPFCSPFCAPLFPFPKLEVARQLFEGVNKLLLPCLQVLLDTAQRKCSKADRSIATTGLCSSVGSPLACRAQTCGLNLRSRTPATLGM